VLGKTPIDMTPPEETGRVAERLCTAPAERRPFSRFLNWNVHSSGRHVLLETSGVPIRADDGTLLGFLGISRDVTARRPR
jgi:PAS domain S-box-containing protein